MESAISKQGKPSIVLAHGLWADGSCFSKLIPRASGEGHGAGFHGSLDSLGGDVASVVRCLVRSRPDRPGRSTPTAERDHARRNARRGCRPGLYRGAWPGRDRDVREPTGRSPPPTSSPIEVADGRIWLRPDGVPCFAGDLRSRAEACLGNQAVRCRTCSPRSRRRWRSKPSWFIVARQDRTVHPGATVDGAADGRRPSRSTNHVPMLSTPAPCST